jgi:hypothetical protein
MMTTTELKNEIRSGEYAWPGGYPKYFVTDDGEAMSFDSVKENYRLVLDSVKHKNNDGWRVVGVDINWEDDSLICCHSGDKIESAYGE